MICFIPSKGRPNTKTHKLFEDVGIEVIHFLEPQDYDTYKHKNKINIGKNDQGIGFVRSFMLNYAKQNSHKWVLMCDDDVTSFGIYKNKTIKKDASIWKEIFNKAEKLPFELIGINYVQHAWHEKTSYSINKKFAEVCVLMNTERIKWDYRSKFNLKEDRDFALQTVKYGAGILRFNHYWFSCPDVGTNKGGLQDEYKNKKDLEASIKMFREWSPFTKMNRKGKRVDVKLDIKGLALNYKKQVK